MHAAPERRVRRHVLDRLAGVPDRRRTAQTLQDLRRGAAARDETSSLVQYLGSGDGGDRIVITLDN
jgi:hypothetical protein